MYFMGYKAVTLENAIKKGVDSEGEDGGVEGGLSDAHGNTSR